MKPSRKFLRTLGVLAALFLAAWIGFFQRPVSYFNHLTYLQMELSGVDSRWVTVDGIRVHYYVQGQAGGPPVVLVHGLGGHAEDWRNLTPFLRRAGFRIYTPDLPGYGRSQKPKNFSYSVQDEANVVVGFMNALGLKQVDLGGHSMGGWIVQLVAYQHPDRIKRLMLFDSAGLHDRPTWNTDLFVPTTALQLDQLDALLMPHPPQVPAFIANDILRTARENGWIIRRAMNSMLTGNDTTDAMLPALKMPVLIVWGSQDQITPLSEGEKMHHLIPQSQLEVVQGCGHLAPVQCAHTIGPQMDSFLKP
jgi:pimeloyl-ACP methyl ester carboxylesterase